MSEIVDRIARVVYSQHPIKIERWMGAGMHPLSSTPEWDDICELWREPYIKHAKELVRIVGADLAARCEAANKAAIGEAP